MKKINQTNKKFRLCLTPGDINGIGPEVILKSLDVEVLPEDVDICISGPEYVFEEVQKYSGIKLHSSVRFYEPELKINRIEINYGAPSAISGKVAYASLKNAIELAKKQEIDAIITAPLSKKALEMAGYKCCGHTEILQEAFPGANAQMLFVSENINLLLLTRHIPLKEVSEKINKDFIVENVIALNINLKRDLNFIQPSLAICALNPHAGECGSIGREEQDIIIPAVQELIDTGVNISGPYSADSFWKTAKDYDCVISLYHDQGLIPLKMYAGENLVNVTAGLPVVRTSPCHGTAYNIAGKFVACEKSMTNAIILAHDILLNRHQL
jgi:4-hydroxythreonine-4-phosphate dehydrogenase